MFRLAKDIATLQQQALTDNQVKGHLDALAQKVPEIAASLDQHARKSEKDNAVEALYGINREFAVDVRDSTPQQRDVLMQGLLGNPLVISADMGAASAESEKAPGQLLASGRRSASADVAQPSYRTGPDPAAGYRVGGINSEAASSLPGGKGERARVVIASDNYWDRSHESLPSLAFSPVSGPKRLSCSTYYTLGNYANAAAGIIAGKDNGRGVTGIVPQAQLTAVPATFASIYNEIYDAGLRPGDVVVLDPGFSSTTSRYGDFVPYPGDTCPKARPTDQSTRTCQLPSVGYEITQRRVEILTEEMGVHVVINASGGIAHAQDPATPLNLDHPDFNGLFDRSRNDDGGIYVSSIEPRTGATLAANYGGRIDLSTWGTHITYPSYQAGAGHDTYSRYDREDALEYRFSAYIVAGAVAQIQSIAFAKGLGAVPPKLMRRLLVETGHAFPGQVAGHPVGRQPDVRAAVDRMLADYSQGFPAEPPEPFHIKRVVGFGTPFHGRDWEYRPIVAPTGVTDVSYHWEGLYQDPLESPRIDPQTGALRLAVGWSEDSHQPLVRLVATDRLGHGDQWSRTLDIPRLVWWHSGEWNVPDVIASGQTVSFSAKINTPPRLENNTSGHYFYWKAPGLFAGTRQGSVPARQPHTLTVKAPEVTKDEEVRVQLLVTEGELRPATQIATSQPGIYLSKIIRIQPGSVANPPPGDCATPWSASTVYATPGVRVSHDGHNYEVAHWTQGAQPDKNFVLSGSAKPWRQIGSCTP
ncbi:S8 family peptidase [Pseudomonas gingeri]|uniref:S8 family peptidase n=1 Tax=Pseudomonas gingeri TaxID=117681 RepID=UPI0015A2C84E|nr:hypothetical protein [Pseudomonas gingeri]NWA11240.1 hypothetical protein [Pseudomonas gingeri]